MDSESTLVESTSMGIVIEAPGLNVEFNDHAQLNRRISRKAPRILPGTVSDRFSPGQSLGDSWIWSAFVNAVNRKFGKAQAER